MNYLQASPTEFRYRYWTHALVFTLGFWSPWDRLLPTGSPLAPHQSAWLALSSALSRNTALSFSNATITLLLFGIIAAMAAAFLRTWGAAYLGAFTVIAGQMQASRIVAAGPYRHVRNPLYLGTWLHALALALLMPPTGAIFVIIAIAVIQARLIAGEEAFLTASGGPAYTAYHVAVPRILPSISPRVATSETKPNWLQAIVAEFYMIGVALAFATLGWRYNAFLLTQCVVVALGLSFVARASLPVRRSNLNAEKPAPEAGISPSESGFVQTNLKP